VKSRTTRRFRDAFKQLPADVRRQARQAYQLFLHNPNHPSLHFKQVDAQRSLYSIRIGLNYRALGVRNKDRIVWLWVGSHADYDKLLK
jgi:hypothetical protein